MKNQNIRSAAAAAIAAACLLVTTGFSAQAAFSQTEVTPSGFAEVGEKGAGTITEANAMIDGTNAMTDGTDGMNGMADAAGEKLQATLEEGQRLTEEAVRLAEEEAGQKAEEQARREAEAQAASEQNSQDRELLAALIFCEAGNQPYEGQVAVGAVVMNRVRSASYPNSISEVVYQSGQFGPAMTGWLDSVLAGGSYTDAAMQAAGDAMSGVNPIGDCLYFGCGNYGIQIGDHYFH